MAETRLTEKLVYLIAGPASWGLSIEPNRRLGNHHQGSIVDGRLVIWPEVLAAPALSLPEFKRLILETGTHDWVFADSLTGTDEIFAIKNHINRSGTNPLRSQTPFEGGVMFLDVSNIYQPVAGLPELTVSTLGEERFYSKEPDDKQRWSLGAGLVTPLAHYLDVKITCVGTSPKPEKIKKITTL